MSAEHLFEAIGYVGADLVDTAEHTVPAARPWRRWVATAAVMAVLVGCAVAVLPEIAKPNPQPNLQQADPVAPIRTTMVLDGKIYYVDDLDKMPEQDQLENQISGIPLDILPTQTGSAELDQAVIFPTDDAEKLILRLGDEYHTAYTYGEIYGMQFGYEMASASSSDTLLQVFVEPIEDFFPYGLRFANPSEVNDGHLMQFWEAMLHARDAAGIRSLEIEAREIVSRRGTWSYSVEEIREILDQYLTGHGFSFTTGVFAVPAREPTAPVYPVLRETKFDEGTRKMILQVDVYGDMTHEELLRESTYTIQFTADSYRYLSILDRRPDQISEEAGTNAPTNPAD